MKYLFINGSPNGRGNTARLAAALLAGKDYTTLNLNDYQIAFYGQHAERDDFPKVLSAMEDADVLVMGSPMYWHSMGAAFSNLLDRSYGGVPEGALAGKKLWFVFQGAAPTKEQLNAGEFTMRRYAGLYGMSYEGMVTNEAEARKAAARLA